MKNINDALSEFERRFHGRKPRYIYVGDYDWYMYLQCTDPDMKLIWANDKIHIFYLDIEIVRFPNTKNVTVV